MDWNEERQLIKIAKMYYEDGLTQQDIAQRLGIYRTTITRLLQKARDTGIVTFSIKGQYKEQVDLEDQLLKAFDLKDVIIVPSNEHETHDTKQRNVMEVALKLLDEIVTDEDVLGISSGSTVSKIVDLNMNLRPRKVEVVPLVGGPGGRGGVNRHINTITYNLAQSFQTHATLIDVPAIVPSVSLKEEFMKFAFLQDIVDLWEKLTIALFGIGPGIPNKNIIFSFLVNEDEMNDIKNLNAAGEICCRLYDENGEPIQSDIDDRTITIPLQVLKKAKTKIAVVEQPSKADAIIAALRGGYISHLITNEETASAICNRIHNK